MPKLDPTLLQLLPGCVIADRYEVVRSIKQGGMGAVYEVLDSQTNRRRGLKVLLPSVALDSVSRERFRKEATVSGRVESDHIVEALDAGVDQRTGADFLVMELLRGEDLAAEITRRGRLPAAEVLDYLSQVAVGLQKVHAEGIAHRDLKLENIFVTRRDDESPLLKILDLGVAKVFETETGPLQTTQVVGTPLYMAPEQLTGDAMIDHRADLYSLGHLAFTLLSGHGYWEPELRDSATVYRFMAKVMEGAVVGASERALEFDVELPASIDAWFARATARDANDRFPSAIAMVLSLSDALSIPAPQSLVREAQRRDRQGAYAPALDSLGATVPLPGGDSTTGVVGPRARTATHSRMWVAGAIIATVVVLAGVAVWRAAMTSPAASLPPETKSSETVSSLAAPAETSNAPTKSAPIAATTAAPPASAETKPKLSPPTKPAAKASKPSRAAAARPTPKARPAPAPKAPATPPPKSGYDPLDEL